MKSEPVLPCPTFSRLPNRPPCDRWNDIHAHRILLADDDAFTRTLAAAALANDGFTVHTARDGEQAWNALRLIPFDLLITNNDLPGLEGPGLLERIRQAGLSLPVIVASGTLFRQSVRHVQEFEITAIIPKPFHLPELLDAVHRGLMPAGADEDPHEFFLQDGTNPRTVRQHPK